MKLPKPEVGLVICYSYLWRSERRQGQAEGRKNRPCLIVAVTQTPAGQRVTVAPITHAPPKASSAAVELPAAVKRHLGLDEERSWIILEEVNQFLWPGFDLRPASEGRSCYGLIPPKLFDRVIARLSEEIRAQQLGLVRRD